jgi:small-conductance mechanosensitive channel
MKMLPGSEDEPDVGPDARLSSLLGRFERLQFTLSQFRERCKDFGEQYGPECSSVLMETLLQLLEITKHVNKADRLVIHWHSQSKTMKTALGLVGLRKQTQAKIDEKTAKLKVELLNLESKFNATSVIFHSSLQNIETLNEEIRTFSSSNVGEIVREAQKLCEQFREDCLVVEQVVEGYEEVHAEVQGSLEASENAKRNVTSERLLAEKSQRNMSGVNYLRFNTCISADYLQLSTMSFLGATVTSVGLIFVTGGVGSIAVGLGMTYGLVNLGMAADSKSE